MQSRKAVLWNQLFKVNSLAHVSPVTVPVHCRLWNVEGGGMQSVEREEVKCWVGM